MTGRPCVGEFRMPFTGYDFKGFFLLGLCLSLSPTNSSGINAVSKLFSGFIPSLPGIGKTSIFGLIVSTVGCYHGYNTEHGTFGVGQATKTAVVRSILLILIADVFLTKLTLLLWP